MPEQMLSKGAESVTGCKAGTSATIQAGWSAESFHCHLDDNSKQRIDSGRNKQWFQYSIFIVQLFIQTMFSTGHKKSLTFFIYRPDSGTAAILH